jgi:hypothetical protein
MIVAGKRQVLAFDRRGCNSSCSYYRLHRNTWLAFTRLARATLATLAAAQRSLQRSPFRMG